jgi:hypothetical protein
MKLDLLTNATVLDDAMRFVSGYLTTITRSQYIAKNLKNLIITTIQN